MPNNHTVNVIYFRCFVMLVFDKIWVFKNTLKSGPALRTTRSTKIMPESKTKKSNRNLLLLMESHFKIPVSTWCLVNNLSLTKSTQNIKNWGFKSQCRVAVWSTRPLRVCQSMSDQHLKQNFE